MVRDEYILAEVHAEDCPGGDDVYIATIPEGAIYMGVKAVARGQVDPAATIDIVVDIGVNDCVFCAGTAVAPSQEVAACVTACECQVTDRDYLVRVQFAAVLEQGSVQFFFHVIIPNVADCMVRAVEPCMQTIMVEPCTGVECTPCDTECPEVEVLPGGDPGGDEVVEETTDPVE